MGLFSKKIGPVFIKDTDDMDSYIGKLQDLAKKASGDTAKEIEKQISWMLYGKKGEANVAYELKNSGMDMYILHDIYLEYKDLSAQIDYLVITRKHTYIIECKMLSGNIEIDSTGAFIRYYDYSGKSFRKGMYSPVTQNRMHLQVIKEIWLHYNENFFTRKNFEKNFDTNFQSIVVLANPETCIDMKYAPKEIKEQVIRADQLITFIRQKDSDAKSDLSNGDMLDAARFYMRQHRPNKLDYAAKYEKLLHTTDMNEQNKVNEKKFLSTTTTQYTAKTVNVQTWNPSVETKDKEDSNNNEILIKQLKEFRLKQSKNEGIAPYLIFNNAQMDDLISKMPHTTTDLLKVSGFNTAKADKYGDAILHILQNFNTRSSENNYYQLTKKLKEYRLRQSKAEGIAPYLIFNDAQMEDLLFKKPHTTEDLLKVSGFGTVKVNKYGESIIKILWDI